MPQLNYGTDRAGSYPQPLGREGYRPCYFYRAAECHGYGVCGREKVEEPVSG